MLVDILLVIFGVLLTLGTAIFVAVEFSLVTLDPARVQKDTDSGDVAASRVQRALKHLSREISTAQVGITITTILLGYTAQPALTRLFTRALSPWLAQTVALALSLTISLVLVNAFSMIIGEIIPKNAAISDPLRTAKIVIIWQRIFSFLFRPLVTVINGSANAILRWFGLTAAEELSGARSASELAALVRQSAKAGALDLSVATLITRSIGIGRLTALDVMTPRGRIDTLSRQASAQDVIELAKNTGHSRFPVLGENADDVLGIVNIRRAIAVPADRRKDVKVISTSLMSEAPRVPETLQLAQLLMQLREYDNQMALVVDEYGGTSGLVTLEDAVEEVVGEVADEHDPRSVRRKQHANGAWEIEGLMRPDEVEWLTGLKIADDGPYETLGGFLMYKLGHIPCVGEEVTCEGVHLEILKMDGRRVDLVKIQGISATGEVAETR